MVFLRVSFRQKIHLFLGKIHLFVDDDTIPAKDVGLNISDMFFAAIYCTLSIYALSIDEISLLVLALNTVCLIQARIKTLLKDKDYTAKLRDKIVGRDKCGKKDEREAFLKSQKGYETQGLLENISILVDLVCFFIAVSPENFISQSFLFVIVVITLIVLFVDCFISSLSNLYAAHPPMPTFYIQ